MGQRRKARELAVQTIYALDFSETGTDFVEYNLLNIFQESLHQIAEHENINDDHVSVLFARELIQGTILQLEEIEKVIEKHSSNWSLDRIANLDHCILRVAIYEMMFTNTPPPIIINEAIEVAKKFCGESSGKFINGVLDAVHQEIKFNTGN